MSRFGPTIRAVNVDGPPTIGIDVGATKVVAGVVAADGRILDREARHLTPSSGSSGLVDPLLRAIAELRARTPGIDAVGVGTAGLVHWPEGAIEFAANHDHRDLKLRQRLEDGSGVRVVVDNDANAAAWGEATTGRYRAGGVLFLAVGTGLGSGFVVNGQLMRGQDGRGAELGHVIVDHTANRRRCGCGLVGCLETVASGGALVEAGQRIVRTDPHSVLAKQVKHSGKVTMDLMIDSARDGDPDVRAAVQEMGGWLGRAIAQNVMSLFHVDRVIVGGGLMSLARLLLDPMRAACDKALAPSKFLNAPLISEATYGKDATLVGAGLLAHQLSSGLTVTSTIQPARTRVTV